MSSIFKIPLLFTIFIVLGLFFGYLTFMILSYSRTVEAPLLINKTLLEANEELSRLSLYLKIEGEDYDSEIPTGRILRQNIPPGNKVKEKRAIKVVLSKGPKVYYIPYVVNQTLDDAESMLLEKGLKIGKLIYVHSDAIEKNRVVAQRPAPDERVKDYVTALVSLGPHKVSYYCPNFVDKDLEIVFRIAKQIGINVETEGEGTIVTGQSPKAGTIIETGDKVVIELREEIPMDFMEERFL
jgi:serine/threonine-protein kinase